MSRRQKLLAEAKAWRECAERMDRPPLDFLRGHLSRMAGYYGMAFVPCVRDASITPTISEDLFRRMTERLNVHSAMAKSTLPSERGFRATRVLAALFLALECEDEARSLRSPKPRSRRQLARGEDRR